MPYSSVSEVPDYVPKDKKKQWLEVWNSAYDRNIKDGKSKEDSEQSAFAQANAVAGPNAKMAKVDVKYEARAQGNDQCQFCSFFNKLPGDGYDYGSCSNSLVLLDDKLMWTSNGLKRVNAVGWCTQFDLRVKPETNTHADEGERIAALHVKMANDWPTRTVLKHFDKFIPFVKVDAQKREVWGVVTAEVPDKDDEVCGYAETKPFYQALIDEMSKASDGNNFMPLREMHQASAVGKGIGYEFRDSDKEIFFGFKVVDDKAWQKVDEKVYTGFSHGGGYAPVFKLPNGDFTTHIPDPVFKDCMRYAAKVAEVSLVDNPCLGVAHFTYVSKTGEVSLRKNRSTVVPSESKRIAMLEKQVASLMKTSVKIPEDGKPFIVKDDKTKTKRVAGEDLTSDAFLIVGDKDRTETWKLPVKFSSDVKTKRHIRNALARISQVKGISEAQREAARKKLHSLASQHGIDVAEEQKKFLIIQSKIRKMARIKVSRYARVHGDPGHKLSFLDGELGKLSKRLSDERSGKLIKGMCEVSNLSWLIQDLSCLVCQVINEQEYEGDDTSPLPGMLEANVDALLDSLIAMVAEEADELRDSIADRVS